VSDLGLTHVAFVVADLDASVAFYRKYAGMEVVHQRVDPHAARVAWVSDRTRPFVVVLVEAPRVVPRPVLWTMKRLLRPAFRYEHLGVGCASRADVDRLCAEAERDGCLGRAPSDSGPPIGYWGFVLDPDGHTLELSFGQEVGLAVAQPTGT
jgi:catechol 2,3-dioxygenase-like lactoylglutathione lyase family enzyme